MLPVKLLDPETSIEPVTSRSFCTVVDPESIKEPVIIALPLIDKELSNVIDEPETTNEPETV